MVTPMVNKYDPYKELNGTHPDRPHIEGLRRRHQVVREAFRDGHTVVAGAEGLDDDGTDTAVDRLRFDLVPQLGAVRVVVVEVVGVGREVARELDSLLGAQRHEELRR